MIVEITRISCFIFTLCTLIRRFSIVYNVMKFHRIRSGLYRVNIANIFVHKFVIFQHSFPSSRIDISVLSGRIPFKFGLK